MSDRSPSRVSLMLTGGTVTAGFRAALFAAANRAGISINEFVLQASAEKLRAAGADVTGLFEPGDLITHNDNSPSDDRRQTA